MMWIWLRCDEREAKAALMLLWRNISSTLSFEMRARMNIEVHRAALVRYSLHRVHIQRRILKIQFLL